MKKYDYLGYDYDRDRLIFDGTELHCGNTFEAYIHNSWIPVRLEYDNAQWYLPNIPRYCCTAQLINLLVRR